MGLDRSRLVLRDRSAGLIGNQQHLGPQEGTVLVEFQNFEAIAALGNQIEAAIRIFLGDADDLGGASHFGNAFVEGAYYAEGSIVGTAFPDHFFVSRLEDMQWQRSSGKQYNFQREQGKQGHEVSGSRAKQLSLRLYDSGAARRETTGSSQRDDVTVRNDKPISPQKLPRVLTCNDAEHTTRAWNLPGKSWW